jgi:hypothetical protein
MAEVKIEEWMRKASEEIRLCCLQQAGYLNAALTAEIIARAYSESGQDEPTVGEVEDGDSLRSALTESFRKLDKRYGKRWRPVVAEMLAGESGQDEYRRGWEAGRDAAVKRLQDEYDSWNDERNQPGAVEGFIVRRLGQISTHIAQLRDLQFPAERSHAGQEGK